MNHKFGILDSLSQPAVGIQNLSERRQFSTAVGAFVAVVLEVVGDKCNLG
jgi:hypothetical protein